MNLSLAPQRVGSTPVTKKQKATQEKQDSNAYSREYGSSPVFSFTNEDITAGSEWLIDFFQDKPAMQKYGSFTNFTIQNNSSVELKLYLNQDRNRVFTIPAGVIRTFEPQDIQGGVLSLIIKNNGSATASSGLITIEAFKVGVEIQDTFKRLHKKFFRLGGY